MHKLKSIDIKGFRGQRSPIHLRLKEDANFLIGRNGTGKTTLINLIHAALAVDIPALREARFDLIEMTFKKDGSR
ncbi:MAG TPA: AAA family ATPase, partial [Allosphingosinicella sp.]